MRTVIVASTIERANSKLEEIYNTLNKDKIKSYWKSKNGSNIIMIDGTEYKVINLNENTKGIRWDCVYVEHGISFELFDAVIRPMGTFVSEIHWF